LIVGFDSKNRELFRSTDDFSKLCRFIRKGRGSADTDVPVFAILIQGPNGSPVSQYRHAFLHGEIPSEVTTICYFIRQLEDFSWSKLKLCQTKMDNGGTPTKQLSGGQKVDINGPSLVYKFLPYWKDGRKFFKLQLINQPLDANLKGLIKHEGVDLSAFAKPTPKELILKEEDYSMSVLQGREAEFQGLEIKNFGLEDEKVVEQTILSSQIEEEEESNESATNKEVEQSNETVLEVDEEEVDEKIDDIQEVETITEELRDKPAEHKDEEPRQVEEKSKPKVEEEKSKPKVEESKPKVEEESKPKVEKEKPKPKVEEEKSTNVPPPRPPRKDVPPPKKNSDQEIVTEVLEKPKKEGEDGNQKKEVEKEQPKKKPTKEPPSVPPSKKVPEEKSSKQEVKPVPTKQKEEPPKKKNDEDKTKKKEEIKPKKKDDPEEKPLKKPVLKKKESESEDSSTGEEDPIEQSSSSEDEKPAPKQPVKKIEEKNKQQKVEDQKATSTPPNKKEETPKAEGKEATTKDNKGRPPPRPMRPKPATKPVAQEKKPAEVNPTQPEQRGREDSFSKALEDIASELTDLV